MSKELHAQRTDLPTDSNLPSEIASELDCAIQERTNLTENFWIAAYPCDAIQKSFVKVTEESSPLADEIKRLPIGDCQYGGVFHSSVPIDHIVLVFSLSEHFTDACGKFLAFAKYIGSYLCANPPSWYSAPVQGEPEAIWAEALLMHNPTRSLSVEKRPSGLLIISDPWMATIAALRDWDNPKRVLPSARKDSKSPPKPRGRTPDTDFEKDKKIYDAWHTGLHSSLDELSMTMEMTKDSVRKALDRHRKRLPRPE